MEPYRSYGRGQHGHPSNQRGMNHNSYHTSLNSCNTNSNSCNMKSNSCAGNHNYMQNDNMPENNCGCKDNNPHMGHMPIAMAYVPIQKWGEMYDPENALRQGTAFPQLNLTFCGSRGKM